MESLTHKVDNINIESFLSHLRSLDIQLSVESDWLKLNAPKGVVTVSLRVRIKRHKTDFRATPGSTQTP